MKDSQFSFLLASLYILTAFLVVDFTTKIILVIISLVWLINASINGKHEMHMIDIKFKLNKLETQWENVKHREVTDALYTLIGLTKKRGKK